MTQAIPGALAVTGVLFLLVLAFWGMARAIKQHGYHEGYRDALNDMDTLLPRGITPGKRRHIQPADFHITPRFTYEGQPLHEERLPEDAA